MTAAPVAAGRCIDAGLHLLDRQLVDGNGHFAGNVDDIEIDLPEDGLPIVTALWTGPGVLGRRSRGRIWGALGRLHEWVASGLGGGPSRIPFADVKRVSHRIELAVPREALDAHVDEAWIRIHVIEKIPGAFDAPE